MQAVILAAGKSTRTYPLTITGPKPLLPLGDKTLIEYTLSLLVDFIDEAIIIIGYKGDMVQAKLGNSYQGISLIYVQQQEQKGTGHALLAAQHAVKGRFFLVMGDDVYSKDAIEHMSAFEHAVCVKEVQNPINFGVIVEKGGILTQFIEKPKLPVSKLANTGLYVLTPLIFDHLVKVKESIRNEIELPDAILTLSKQHQIHVFHTTTWMPIAYPWDLLAADEMIRDKQNLIKDTASIEGTIVNSNIGDNCVIKGIVRNSIIMSDSIIEEGSIVENSIIGRNVIFSGTAISADKITIIINDKEIILKKCGCVIGDNVNANNVTIKPGCRIWPDKKISGEIDVDVQ